MLYSYPRKIKEFKKFKKFKELKKVKCYIDINGKSRNPKNLRNSNIILVLMENQGIQEI